MRQASEYGISRVCLAVVSCVLLGAGLARADFTVGEPVNVGPTINSSDGTYDPSISSDGLSLYFCSNGRPGGLGGRDLWVATRPTTADPWGEPVNLDAPVNSPQHDDSPFLSRDGLELYFQSKRPGGYDGQARYVCMRATPEAPWSEPVNLGPDVASGDSPSVSTDGLELYFCAYERPGGYGSFDLWVSRRPTRDTPWGTPEVLPTTVNTSLREMAPEISDDGRVLFFARDDSADHRSIFMSLRVTPDHPWGPAFNLGVPFDGAFADDTTPSFWAQGLELYFSRNDRLGIMGSHQLWKAPVIPVVDFTGDAKVDIKDLTILIDHWGQDAPAYDMGPMPWGDGVIDAADLEVLMSYWGQYDPRLLAHWKLDETEGDVAGDSAGDNDGTLMGDPVWEPEAGIVDGALAFDGVDDGIVVSEQVLNPADGPFSVLAWIKGGAPGQVLISQTDGMNWLIIDPSEGTLATELVPPAGRFPVPPLVSDVTITDGHWHRIGFTWDGAHRSLYVDDVLVAEDTQTGLAGSNGGLHLGCGSGLEPATFFSGRIDDVHLYNRAVKP